MERLCNLAKFTHLISDEAHLRTKSARLESMYSESLHFIAPQMEIRKLIPSVRNKTEDLGFLELSGI